MTTSSPPAAGAPRPALVYDLSLLRPVYTVASTIPDFSVSRRWVSLTPEELAEQEAVSRANQEMLRKLEEKQRAVVDQACVTALLEGWDVHVYWPPQPFDIRRANAQDMVYRAHVGIEFRPARHPVPTVHENLTPVFWDD